MKEELLLPSSIFSSVCQEKSDKRDMSERQRAVVVGDRCIQDHIHTPTTRVAEEFKCCEIIDKLGSVVKRDEMAQRYCWRL
jgi:hypothetical protein